MSHEPNERRMSNFLIRRDVVFEGRIFRVAREELRYPDGTTQFHEVVERPDTVAVVAIPGRGRLLLVEEYCAALRRTQVSLPGGKVRHLSDVATEAARELREETGYRGSHLERLLSFHVSPSYMTWIVHAFLATDLVFDPLPADAGEAIRVFEASWEEAIAACLTDFTSTGEVLPCILAARKRLGLEKA